MGGRVVFVVQGEGRGHLSQALAMQRLIKSFGLELVAVFVGRSSVRQLPDYFVDHLDVVHEEFQSPNFLTDKNNQGIRVAYSIWLSALRLPRYIATSRKLAKKINALAPDVVINFYDPLVGLSQLFVKIKAPILSIAHQYMVMHPQFKMPKKPIGDRMGLRLLTYISQIGSAEKLALSFYEFPNIEKRGLRVVPPLLRENVLKARTSNGDFILVYVLNSGYADEIIQWQAAHKDVIVHCFWDRWEMENPYSPQENLYFHHLSGSQFIERMANCKAFVTTAGFESVCEAMYLGKPAAMVPVKGHYEQKLNSYDAVLAGAGVRNDDFEFDRLMNLLDSFVLSKEQHKATREWFESMESNYRAVLRRYINI